MPISFAKSPSYPMVLSPVVSSCALISESAPTQISEKRVPPSKVPEGVPPFTCHKGVPPLHETRGGACLFFEPGGYTPRFPLTGMKGYPLKGTQRRGYIPFSGTGFTSESTFVVCSKMAARLYPRLVCWGGGCRSGARWSVGYPCLRVTCQWQAPPSKVPKGAPPSRFPARVYVGD